MQKDIDSGVRQTRPFELKAEIRSGTWFIVGGQKAYVADMGEIFSNAQGRTDARLCVIFDNGTESPTENLGCRGFNKIHQSCCWLHPRPAGLSRAKISEWKKLWSQPLFSRFSKYLSFNVGDISHAVLSCREAGPSRGHFLHLA